MFRSSLLSLFISRAFFALLYCPLLSSAQGICGPVGASAWMTGGASVSQQDVWSVNNNPGAMAFAKQSEFGLYTEQRFRESRLKMAAVSALFKTRWSSLGSSVQYYGYEVFNQQKIGLSVARQLSPLMALGIQVNYLATNIRDYGSSGAFVFAGGLLVKPARKLRMGIMIFNPTQEKYSNRIGDKIPSYARFGMTCDVSDKVMLQAEADQALAAAMILRGGLHYQVHEVFSLALGVAGNPLYYTFGTTLRVRRFRLDLASSFHEVLGFTPHLGVTLPAGKKQ